MAATYKVEARRNALPPAAADSPSPQAEEAPMYVCLCRGITEKQLHAAAAAGARSLQAVYRCLGGPPQCGKCVPYARYVLDQGGSREEHRSDSGFCGGSAIGT